MVLNYTVSCMNSPCTLYAFVSCCAPLIHTHPSVVVEVPPLSYILLGRNYFSFYTARSAGQKGCVNMPLLRKSGGGCLEIRAVIGRHPNHHGYRKNHNTTTALLQIYDNWVETDDRGEYSSVCFLDLSAAFDVVDHDLLLGKLEVYGFDENSVKWMGSYLKGRKQVVYVDGSLSGRLEIEAGVPQGSILGPLMYIIFTNDLPEIIHEHAPNPISEPENSKFNVNCTICGTISCYADDSTFSCAGKDSMEMSVFTSEKYLKMADYMTSNKLKLNGDKTHLMVMMNNAARRHHPNFQVQLNTGQEIIEESKSERLLGAQISQNLKWYQHIRDDEKSLLKSLNARLNALKKVSHMASFKTRKMIGN
jgi:hypothetical protein